MSITTKTLDDVERECKEMLDRIKAFKSENKPYNDKGDYHSYGSRISGAMRRQTLELSTALIALRKR